MDSKTLKVLKAEAKAVGLKNYSKLTREELIQKTADKVEQNALASSLSLSTLITENKTVPEPVENKNDPDCSLTIVHIDKPAEPLENKNEPEPVENKNEPVPPPVEKKKRVPAKKKEKKEKAPTEKKEKKEKRTGPNKWQEHVKAYREAHPQLSYKQAMIDAKQTYKTE
jgi:hypothetical protein